MVSPASRRRAVKSVVEEGLGSTLQACRALNLARSSFYRPCQRNLSSQRQRQQVVQLSEEHPRYGYRRVTALLRREGLRINAKRVQRLRRVEGLQVRRRQRRMRRLGPQQSERLRASCPRQVWSWDFVEDQTENGTRFRILTLLDEYTRECLAVHAAWSIRAVDAITVIEAAIERYGAPQNLRSDNGPEFIAYAIQDWLQEREIKTLYIKPGSPWENGHIESFHDKLRDEFLNRELFGTLAEARVLLESWRVEYNQYRPHSSLGYLTPQEFAHGASKFGLLPASGLLPPKFAKINQTRLYQTNQPAELQL
ncbi:MAG: IS3 family transposase [Chthoniobacterales bacterium]|jgi:transposase InsO family protein|nr:IS3 family transposase [Chthoniobacterales bacterium]